jgi:hypothetical protein
VVLEFDMIQELMNGLAARGGHYQIAVQVQQFAFPPVPGLILPSTLSCVAVLNYNAILVRTDLDPSQFQWRSPQSGQFVNRVVLPTPLGPIPIPRAWASVDVMFHKRGFRFIGTHLDATVASIRELQGAELRAGPANTSLPVVVAMDSNAQASPFPQDATYTDFIAAGYQDAWVEVFPVTSALHVVRQNRTTIRYRNYRNG